MKFVFIQMLQEVMKSYAKKLTIQLDVNDLQEERITTLKDLFRSHRGDAALNFVVYEAEEKVKLHMPSRKQRVDISAELVESLEESQIHYKLN